MIKLENLGFYSAKNKTSEASSLLITANDEALVSIPSFENFINTDNHFIKASTVADIEIDIESKTPNFKVTKMTIAGEKGSLLEYYILPIGKNFNKEKMTEGVLSSSSANNIFKDLYLNQEFSLTISLK